MTILKNVNTAAGTATKEENAVKVESKKEETVMTREEAIKRMTQLAHNYDPFTAYIDNYRQMLDAERANKVYETEWNAICQEYGIQASIYEYANLSDTEQEITALFTTTNDKEETAMNEINTNVMESATNNVENKEETTMNEKTTAMNNATVNNATVKEETMNTEMSRIDDMHEVLAALEVKKTSDPAYLDKNAIAEILKGLVGKEMSKREIKNTKRENMVNEVVCLINEALATDGDSPETTQSEVTGIPVGDLPMTADNVPEEIVENTATATAKVSIQEYINKGVTPDRLKEYVLGRHIYKRDNQGNIIVDEAGNKVVSRTINGIAHYLKENAKKDMKYGNYINHFILTSIIAEQLVGRPLKDRRTGAFNDFSENEKKVIQGVRDIVVSKLTRYQHLDDKGQVTGYRVTAYVLVTAYNGMDVKFWYRKDKDDKGFSIVVSNGKAYSNIPGQKAIVKDMVPGIYLWLDENASYWRVDEHKAAQSQKANTSSCPF